MRILHIINNLNKGGAERLLVDNLPLYIKADVHVEVLQLSELHSEPQYLKTLLDGGVKCHSLGQTSLYNPLLVMSLVKFLSQNRFDIVHVHLFPAMYWVAIASKFISQKPVLVFTEHSTQNKRSKNSLLKPLEIFIYRSYNSIIAISEQIKDKLISWTGFTDKIRVIRNGVDTLRFEQAPKYDDLFWTNEFSIPRGSVKMLMTARFSYPKDHATLVRALSQLPGNHFLILVGEGPNKEEIKALSLVQGVSERVIFAGFRNDVSSLMKSVDINILSTDYEGMSGVSLEALASGQPFLGSDVAGINDLVPDSRYLFAARNSDAAAQQITNIIANPALKTSMISDGLEHASKFDVNYTLNNHLKLYSEIVTH
ncbi:glycosyltransferase [Dyadobacter sp. CY312]|uniref:glycosyltransferase n=1 Tax=Dyadobacter sp. CY312 TaxID=2907303 RepID=UPI001F29929D|nr:glycosyltransferase [Dyadobacter sp. CY312]MCE7041268.1 glycosyltransferase [Dyadobacter sp. CY312]